MNRIKDELAKRNRIRQQVLKIRNTGGKCQKTGILL